MFGEIVFIIHFIVLSCFTVCGRVLLSPAYYLLLINPLLMRTLSVVTGGSRAMEYIWLVGKLDPLHGELGFQVPFKRESSTSSAQLISCQVESPMAYGSETAHYPDTNYGQTW